MLLTHTKFEAESAVGGRRFKVGGRQSAGGGGKSRYRHFCRLLPGGTGIRACVSPPLYRFVALAAWCAIFSSAAAEPAKFESRYYTITTDLDSEFTKDIAGRADLMYAEYSQRLKEFAPSDQAERFEIRLFDRRVDYLRLTGDKFSNTGGIFMSGRNILAVYLEEQGRESLRRTLQHEAFHQFAFTNISPNLPIWLNEGLAQVFEEGLFTGTGFQLGEVPPRRVRQLQHDLAENRLTSFKAFLALTDTQWQSMLRDRTLAATNYNQSWAMVHFLVFARNPKNQFAYRPLLLAWMKRIHDGQDPDEAYQEVFGKNVANFQKAFAAWAQQLVPTPEARALENQTVLGDLMIELYNRGQRFDSVAKFREEILRGQYQIHYSKGQMQWSTEKDPAIYFADLNGQRFQANQLKFDPRPAGPLPDIACQPAIGWALRTRFYRLDGKIERETLVEPRPGR